jgi:DNA-binding IclR family transcriptional regulator
MGEEAIKPESKLNRFLPAINGEPKALVLLNLTTDVALNGRELRRKISQQLGTTYNLPGKSSLEAYCKQSFIPAGLVVSEGNYYRLTPEGAKYGQPIAAFLLDWSYMNDTSINRVLGFASTRGETNAPFNRANILEILSLTEDITKSELARRVHLVDNGISRHLKFLQSIGYLTFESVGKAGNRIGHFKYDFVESSSPVQSIDEKPLLTRQVYEALREAKSGDRNSLAKILGRKPTTISPILTGLVNQGHAVQQQGKWIWGEKYSKISITNLGKTFVNKFLNPIKDALNDGPYLEIFKEQYLKPITEDSEIYREIVQTGLDNYSAHSSNMNTKSRSFQLLRLRAMIITNGETTIERASHLMGLSRTRTGEYLGELARRGVLGRRLNEDSEVVFSLKQH